MSSPGRRNFLQSSVALVSLPLLCIPGKAFAQGNPSNQNNRFKLSLNAYSFNEPLKGGKTHLPELIEFCAAEGFDAIDLTGYYFPGYPDAPPDNYIYQLKRTAHQWGIAISGTGIRNDFSQPGKSARSKEVALVKRWIEVAAKLGAPVIRIFSGLSIPDNYTRETVAGWISDEIKICVDYGKSHGVIVAVQNHNDFIKTAAQAIDLVSRVDSEWFGMVLDTGSFVTNEPYAEITKAAPFAVNWQIKESLNYNGNTENMNLVKLFQIIKASPYRGYLPIETLSAGDPFVIVPPFFKQVRTAMEKVLNS